jgi:hypothetical protein
VKRALSSLATHLPFVESGSPDSLCPQKQHKTLAKLSKENFLLLLKLLPRRAMKYFVNKENTKKSQLIQKFTAKKVAAMKRSSCVLIDSVTLPS